MEDKKRKYAKFLLVDCLKLGRNDKLFIIGTDIIQEFIDITIEEARNIGIEDIETLIRSPFKEKELYQTLSYEEIIAHPLFDKTKYNTMAEEGYAFLNLQTTIPNIFNGVDAELLSKVNAYQMESIEEYREYQSKKLIKWNISCVANAYWAQELFLEPDVDRLWEYIFDICLINEENPGEAWNEKMKKLHERVVYLNNLHIDKLIYHNSLGTDLEIGLPRDYLFQSAEASNLVNMPTEEVFSSPDRLRVEGIVYASKPLIYNNYEINHFWLKFHDGKIIDYDAKEGKEILKGIIKTDEGSHYLGEVAFVDYDSPISQANLVFKHTLYDENASCHLAIGESFPMCLKGGLNMSKEELLEQGLNYSHEHVDFFIGTKDLEIKAKLVDGDEVDIMKEGNFI